RLDPSGSRLTFLKSVQQRDYDLWIKDLRSEHQWRAMDRFKISSLYKFPEDWLESNVIWTPSGDALFLVKRVDSRRQQLVRVDSASGDARVVVDGAEGEDFHDLYISANGVRLAYVRKSGDDQSRSDLFVLDTSTGKLESLFSRTHDRHERI